MPLEPLACLWSSALQVYVTPTSYCVPYPSLTANHAALIQPRKLRAHNVDQNAALQKRVRAWEERGWDFYHHATDLVDEAECDGVRSQLCAAAPRYFGDKYCLYGVMELVGRGGTVPNLPFDILGTETLMWWRGGRTCGAACHSGEQRIIPGYRAVPWDAL